MWADNTTPVEAQYFEISSTASTYVSVSAPCPPNSSPNGMPKKPNSCILATVSSGNMCSSSTFWAKGFTSPSAKSWNISFISS